MLRRAGPVKAGKSLTVPSRNTLISA